MNSKVKNVTLKIICQLKLGCQVIFVIGRVGLDSYFSRFNPSVRNVDPKPKRKRFIPNTKLLSQFGLVIDLVRTLELSPKTCRCITGKAPSA